jgi:hypothetical protein
MGTIAGRFIAMVISAGLAVVTVHRDSVNASSCGRVACLQTIAGNVITAMNEFIKANAILTEISGA